MLGSGSFQFVIADRGGRDRLGVLDGMLSATIRRARDDIGTVTMRVSPRSGECSDLLAGLHTVRNELVVYRNGVRVWEGPITRVAYYPDRVELDASDIMWYLSRTALRFGIDFTGSSVNAVDAVYDLVLKHFPPAGDPFNIGPYVTKINSSDDARTAANYPAYSTTLFEVVDKYAEDGGIDYVVNGRRLIILDTHCRAHELHRLTSEDFTSDLGVVEYGSELVTKAIAYGNEGRYSVAQAPQEWIDYYGLMEKVTSSAQEGGVAEAPAGEALLEQAERTMYSGYPAPVDILVPANSGLDPRTEVEYTDIVPGAWVPVESFRTLRKVQQWQRISEVRTEIGPDGEKVLLTLQQPPARSVPPLGAV